MYRMTRVLIRRSVRDERGATAAEYGLVAALAVLSAMAGIELFGEALGTILPTQGEVDTWDD